MHYLNRFVTNLYRVILKKFPLLRNVIRFFIPYTSLNSSLVYFRRANFTNMPQLHDVSPLYVKEISTNDEFQINDWLKIINQSFLRRWQKKDFVKNIKNHVVYDVHHTYFLMDSKRCVGVVSEAVFKKNQQVGVTHYLGLDKNYLGCGFGKYLILFTLHKMKEHGLKSCEGESTFNYVKSLFIHFDLGFCPKYRLDYWNTANHAPILLRPIISYKLSRLYKKWQKRKY